MDLTASYVAALHQRALREGAAGLVRPSGHKPRLSPQAWARAARWRAAGASEAQIAARLGVAQATVSRHLAGAGQHQLPFGEPAGAPGAAGGGPGPRPEPEQEEPAPGPQRAAEPEPATEPAAAPAPETETARPAGPLPPAPRTLHAPVRSPY